jgi:hypothetical protein
MTGGQVINCHSDHKFRVSKLSWSIFFCGTKTITGRVTQKNDTYYGDRALILDWVFYLDIMYKFSNVIRHWTDKNDDQIKLAAREKIISKAIFSPERQIVRSHHNISLVLPR